MSSRPLPGQNPLPIQTQQFTKEQLQDPGVMNVWFQQLVDALNIGNGTLGMVPQPSGIDMQGSRVANLAPPVNDGDAISSGHAASNYGPAAQQQQLDIGKPYALKGLNVAFATSQQNATAITALQAAAANAATVLGSGGSTPLAAPIIQTGETAAISAGSLAVVFPAAYENTVPTVLVCDDYGSGSDGVASVVKGTVTKTGFTVRNSNTGNGAWWIAVGS